MVIIRSGSGGVGGMLAFDGKCATNERQTIRSFARVAEVVFDVNARIP
jgi:hypothetical protein